MSNKIGNKFCTAYGVPPMNLKLVKQRISFLIKSSFNLENFGANPFFIDSLKKNPTKIYSKVAPIDVDINTRGVSVYVGDEN